MIDGQEKRYDRDVHLDSLAALLAKEIEESNNNCLIWIGSGLSIGCGYPGWRDAIEALCRACIPDKADVRPSDSASELLNWAEQCKAAAPEKYFEVLANLFGSIPQSLTPAYSNICACPFRYYITTNYDPCLQTASNPQQHVLAYPDLALTRTRASQTVVYLHGRARSGNQVSAHDLLLTTQDLTRAYSASLIPSTLDQLLIAHRTIFVGCGLHEPVLKSAFRHIKLIHSNHPTLPLMKKTIMLPETPDNELEREQSLEMQDLGIEILRYPLDEDDPKFPARRYRPLDEIWASVRTRLSQAPHPFNQKGGIPV